jgi:hypothetical protein
MHWSGCPAGCGNHATADIGLLGKNVRIGDEMVEAVDVFVGGRAGPNAKPGTKVLEDVPCEELPRGQIQCRHLFEIAADMGLTEGLILSLNRDIVVGAVGPVCAQTLRGHGVVPDVMPASPSMPALITAVAGYFELTQGPSEPTV